MKSAAATGTTVTVLISIGAALRAMSARIASDGARCGSAAASQFAAAYAGRQALLVGSIKRSEKGKAVEALAPTAFLLNER
jgi:hypothetical protein